MSDKYQIGDIVSVRATIASLEYENTILCSFYAPNANYNNITFTVDMKDIVTHTPKPRPIQVGDTVIASGFTKYEVLAIHEDKAWLKSENGSHIIYLLDKLERAQ